MNALILLLLNLYTALAAINIGSPSYQQVFLDQPVKFSWSLNGQGCQPVVRIYNWNQTLVMSWKNQNNAQSWTVPQFMHVCATDSITYDANAQPGTYYFEVQQCNDVSARLPFYVGLQNQVNFQYPNQVTVTAGKDTRFSWYNAGYTCQPQITITDAQGNTVMNWLNQVNAQSWTVPSLLKNSPSGRYSVTLTVGQRTSSGWFDLENPSLPGASSQVVFSTVVTTASSADAAFPTSGSLETSEAIESTILAPTTTSKPTSSATETTLTTLTTSVPLVVSSTTTVTSDNGAVVTVIPGQTIYSVFTLITAHTTATQATTVASEFVTTVMSTGYVGDN